jgi:hypothetical protein
MAMPERQTGAEAGYMELIGAKKDADCEKVQVKGGISTALGCCNLFWPESRSVNRFRCGDCEYVVRAKKNYFFDA